MSSVSSHHVATDAGASQCDGAGKSLLMVRDFGSAHDRSRLQCPQTGTITPKEFRNKREIRGIRKSSAVTLCRSASNHLPNQLGRWRLPTSDRTQIVEPLPTPRPNVQPTRRITSTRLGSTRQTCIRKRFGRPKDLTRTRHEIKHDGRTSQLFVTVSPPERNVEVSEDLPWPAYTRRPRWKAMGKAPSRRCTLSIKRV